MNLRYARAKTTLLLLFAFHCSTALAQPQDQTLTGDLAGTYTATQTITAHDATVRAGTGATFRAGQAVRLEAGFKAELGATFRAEVDPSLVGGGTCDLAALDLPPTEGNGRFFPLYVTSTEHPSLSLNGFDCEATATGCANGLGLRQILEAIQPGSAEPAIRDVYDEVVVLVDDEYAASPPNRGAIRGNARRLQARAFAALVSYLLERNACDPTELGLPPHDEAADNLRAALLNGASWRIVRDYANDGVKWPWLLGGAARTLDLYLALENAYGHVGHHA